MGNRYYQDEAIDAAMNSENSIIVAPTGSGKSHIISGIVRRADGNTLVLQPSKEVLESNLSKVRAAGLDDAAVYSAAMNEKNVGRVTYATIGSIIKVLDKFSDVENIIIDECHLVSAKGGQYEKLIKNINPKMLVGLTATPYRQSTSSYGTSMKLLHRTRPKIFKKISYCINPCDLVGHGYLMKPEWKTFDFDRSMLKMNTTGAEFSDTSRRRYLEKNQIIECFLGGSEAISKSHNKAIIFVESISDCDSVISRLGEAGIECKTINSKTKPKDRRDILDDFESGGTQFLVNVGTLTTGYDFPALDCVVDCAPTASVSLHYQKIGRVVRPFTGKIPVVYDYAGNYERFGDPLTWRLEPNLTGQFELYSNGGRLTTCIMGLESECDSVIEFGKHSGKKLKDVDASYLEWCCENIKSSSTKQMLFGELQRRRFFEHANDSV